MHNSPEYDDNDRYNDNDTSENDADSDTLAIESLQDKVLNIEVVDA